MRRAAPTRAGQVHLRELAKQLGLSSLRAPSYRMGQDWESEMGFDLWDDRAHISLHYTNHAMSSLLGIIRAAGVTNARLLEKLCWNNDKRVTALQARQLATKLRAWLATEDRLAPHWDEVMLAEYYERQEKKWAKQKSKRPTHIQLDDPERAACYYGHTVTYPWLLDMVEEFIAFCDKAADCRGFVVS